MPCQGQTFYAGRDSVGNRAGDPKPKSLWKIANVGHTLKQIHKKPKNVKDHSSYSLTAPQLPHTPSAWFEYGSWNYEVCSKQHRLQENQINKTVVINIGGKELMSD